MSLQVENLSKTFFPGTNRAFQALNQVQLKLEPGDFMAIVGGNGAGKSTLLNAIAGTFPPSQGSIVLAGQDITSWDEVKRASLISRVFQDPMMGTAPRMTVGQNMALALRRGQKRRLLPAHKKEERAYFQTELASLGLGLEERLDQEMGLLSGGQRQAISLLMAGLTKPQLLLLDEHTAALDPQTQRRIMHLTKRMIEDKGLTSLMITHSLGDALAYGNKLLVLHRGQVAYCFDQEEKDRLTESDLFQLMAQLNQ